MNTEKRNRLISYMLILVSVAGFFAWESLLDPQYDDYWYMRYFPSPEEAPGEYEPGHHFFSCMEDDIVTWEQALASIKHHYFYWNNGRLANALMFVSNLFPKTLVDGFNALMLLLMLVSLAYLSTGPSWSRHPLRVTFILAFFWICWPLHELKGSTDYFFNYIFSTAVILAFICLFNKSTGRRLSILRLIGLCLLALIAGASHEGLSVPVGFGLGCYLILTTFFYRQAGLPNATSAQWISVIFFGIGALFILLSPSCLFRIRTESLPSGGWWISILIDYVIRLYFVYIGIALFLFICFRKGMRYAINGAKGNLLYLFIFIGGAILLYFTGVAKFRATWILFVISTILLTKVTAALRVFRNHGRLSAALSAGSLLLLIAFMTDLCMAQRRATLESRDIYDMMVKTPSGLIYYYDLSLENDPWWRLSVVARRPAKEVGADYMPHTSITHGQQMHNVVLPARYRGVPLDSLPPVPGTAGLKGDYPYYYIDSIADNGTHIALFNTSFAFPDSVPFNVRFTPAAPARLLWHPKGNIDSVSTGYHFHIIALPVTDEMRRLGVIKSGVDTVYFLRPEVGKPTLNGMRPVKIDK